VLTYFVHDLQSTYETFYSDGFHRFRRNLVTSGVHSSLPVVSSLLFTSPFHPSLTLSNFSLPSQPSPPYLSLSVFFRSLSFRFIQHKRSILCLQVHRTWSLMNNLLNKNTALMFLNNLFYDSFIYLHYLLLYIYWYLLLCITYFTIMSFLSINIKIKSCRFTLHTHSTLTWRSGVNFFQQYCRLKAIHSESLIHIVMLRTPFQWSPIHLVSSGQFVAAM